ncbi:hypothetical protein ACHAXR_007547 [Thalassiosira sp. AJA248-18]
MAKKSKTPSVKKNSRNNFNSPTNREKNRVQCKRSVIGAGIASFLAIAVSYAVSSNTYQQQPAIQHNGQNAKKFLKWFVDNGGNFHPIELDNDRSINVTIEEFHFYGGWGLALPIPPESDYGSCKSESCTDGQSPIIRHLQPLFTVPSSIIISVQSILETSTSDFYPRVNKILNQAFPNGPGLAKHGMGQIEQDAVIAMYLMAEDCQHRHSDLFKNDSHWGPYLDVLPAYKIPRLDTFDDDDYAALNDEKLEYAGRTSKRLLKQMHSGMTNGLSLNAVVQDMIRQKIGGSEPLSMPIPSSCSSFDTFHRFVGIVSSRAMVLKGEKHLTPLAEMINYAPKTEMQQRDEDLIRAPFDLYHSLSEDNSITVRSDRDIFLADSLSAEAATIQIFEDYGPVDSSLFLEAHGFVPYENPNNCATIPGSFFLRRNAANGRYDENVELVLRALESLYLIHPETKKFEALEDVCVKENLEIVDDTIGRKPASDSIAIASLLLGDSGDSDNSVWSRIGEEHGCSFASLRDECMAAIRSGDAVRMEIRCARYPGSDDVVKQALRTASRRAKSSFDDTEMKLLLELQQAESQGRNQLALALRFRVEETKILDHIARSNVLGKNRVKNQKRELSTSPENLDEKLAAFDSFVLSLGLPLNKIEPKLVENGMRLGAFATDDLEVEDAYISLTSNSVIDVSTALADVDDASDFGALMRKYSKSNYSQQSDGFDVLLLYLLHEHFVLKEQSRWWAYLELLPTIDELTEFHPLFFAEKEMDRYLACSDVRKFILRYQQRSIERHTALASDLDANLVLGRHVLGDKKKVYWATAVLDSRSIWWNGTRHLSPMLDLVNADGKGRSHETRIEDSEDMKRKLAVTRASRPIRKGEQVFENYAQPNYLLFTYHGFVLEGNTNDCALLDGLFIHRNDPGARSAHRLRSIAPTFCIRDKTSVQELSDFLRVKYGLDNSSISKIDDVVRHLLEERIARLEAVDTTIDEEDESIVLPDRLKFMRQMVKNDLMHFQYALNNHVLS